MVALSALVAGSSLVVFTPAPVAAAPLVEQCNGISNTPGLTVECSVVVVNTVTDDPLTSGSVVSVNGGPEVSSSDIVTAVDQCNGSANGGGGTLLCTVSITTTISRSDAGVAEPATVNQCNDNQADGLGDPPTPCVPFPAATTGATITQCNGSGNGGGLVTPSGCTAAGTVSSALPITINQCNGSANGGGARVICAAQMTTIIAPPTTTTTAPTTTSGPTTTAGPTTVPGGGTTTTVPGGGGTTTTTIVGPALPTTTTGTGISTTTGPRNVPGLPRTGANDSLMPFVGLGLLLTGLGVLILAFNRRSTEV